MIKKKEHTNKRTHQAEPRAEKERKETKEQDEGYTSAEDNRAISQDRKARKQEKIADKGWREVH